MLKSTENKGFSLTFENGLTISVQFGTGNYCDRRKFGGNYGDEMHTRIIESPNAEIAIWDKDGRWYNFGSDTVEGWVPTAEVANWITRVAAAPSNFCYDREELKNECDLNGLENASPE